MKLRIFKNSGIKLIALVVACILWLHVATEQRYEHSFTYPLIIEGLPDEYVLGASLPDSIQVVLKGKGKDLIKLLFSDGEAVIDASGFKYSERFIELGGVELRLPEVDYEFVEYARKDRIRLLIDRYADREVPVKSNLHLEPAGGFAAPDERVRFDPVNIVIGGPENLIRALDYILTEPETLRNLNTTTTLVVGIMKTNPLLSYTPDKVSAYINVEPLFQEKITGIPVEVRSGSPRRDETISPTTIDLTFTGTKDCIESLDRNDIKVFVDYIDVRTQGHKLRPVVIHPPCLNVVSMSPEYFTFITR